MAAHNGLRGLLCLHVCLFHCLWYANLGSDVKVNLAGSAAMPWFFIISGFSLAVIYNTKQWAFQPCCLELCPPLDGQPRLDALAFYQNRFARVMPMTYLIQVLSMPLVFLGHGWMPPDLPMFIVAVLLNIPIPVNTWLGTPPLGFCGPAWTVSTLVFFYAVFPKLLPWMQRFDGEGSHSPMRVVRFMFVVQFLIGVLVYGGVTVLVGPGFAYWTATAWPVSRLPVFLMGCFAGLHCSCGQHVQDGQAAARCSWACSVDSGVALYCVVVLAAFATSVTGMGEVSGLISFASQLFLPLTQVSILVGLTVEHDQSRFGKLCRLRPLQFLGQISMSLYLVHEPLIQYLNCIAYGPLSWPTGDDEDEWSEFQEKRTSDGPGSGMPAWGIPVVVVVALLLAVVMERYLEAPLRRRLRSRRVAVKMPEEGQTGEGQTGG